MRDKIETTLDATEEELKAQAVQMERVIPFIEGKEIVKVIYVPKKLVNIVVK